jgi:hypothetical protein
MGHNQFCHYVMLEASKVSLEPFELKLLQVDGNKIRRNEQANDSCYLQVAYSWNQNEDCRKQLTGTPETRKPFIIKGIHRKGQRAFC